MQIALRAMCSKSTTFALLFQGLPYFLFLYQNRSMNISRFRSPNEADSGKTATSPPTTQARKTEVRGVQRTGKIKICSLYLYYIINWYICQYFFVDCICFFVIYLSKTDFSFFSGLGIAFTGSVLARYPIAQPSRASCERIAPSEAVMA